MFNNETHEISVQQEIQQIEMDKPHVVILGAGASFAAFPKGDKNGLRLPLMNNFVDILRLNGLLSQAGINFKTNNFEDIYNQLYEGGTHREIREELEKLIYRYFSRLEIISKPTIYDHLLLSLREKDYVATFNWDPFLLQAGRRNSQRFKLPRLLFLHGNVGVGYCEKDKTAGLISNRCSNCNCVFAPTKLLYPIAKKDYHLDSFINLQWKELEQQLHDAFMITIFGYGAPQSDVSAMDLMKFAWGDLIQRDLEQTEIIDIRSEDDLFSTWEPFIHTHHFETHCDFYDSWISNHPRRTGEAYINQYLKTKFIYDNPIPKEFGFDELWGWYDQLKLVEET